MEFQGNINSQNNLEKEPQDGDLTLSDFKIYYTIIALRLYSTA